MAREQDIATALQNIAQQIGGALSGVLTNVLDIAHGGTGATTAADARTNLGLGTAATRAASNAAKANVASVDAATVAGNLAQFTDTAGTVGDAGIAYTTAAWTPTLQFGGASTGITYASQTGIYTRIGNLVHCAFIITLTNKGSATGGAAIAGLPVASSGNAANAGSGGTVAAYSNLSGLTGAPRLNGAPSSSSMAIAQTGAAASAQLADTAFTNTSSIAGDFFYFA